MATHSSILAWRILWTEEPDCSLAAVRGVAKRLKHLAHTKDMLKDTNEQSDEEIHEVRSRRVLSAGICPCGVVGLGVTTLPKYGCVH